MLHWQEWYIPETWWSVPQENALFWHSVFIDFSLEMNKYEPSLLKQETHKCYLCEIDSAPSEEKWPERAQHFFNKKTLLVYAVFTGNNNICRKEL